MNTFMNDDIYMCARLSVCDGESGELFLVLSSPVVRIGDSYCVLSERHIQFG